jgi:hypothetical protein
MKVKNCTDLEQSRKLSKILKLESADMCYPLPYEEGDKPLLEKGGFGSIPCWSLAALLSALPYFIGDYGKCLYCDVGGYYCGYMVDGKFMLSIEETNADNPIDACYEMIIKLHKQDLI